MRAIVIALRSLSREWRYGELAVLLLSLSVAVGALTGVGFLVDRINRSIALQASEVLAADIRVQSPRPLSADNEPMARQLGLRTARLTTLLSAVFHGDVNQLTNIRMVTDGYPLRGTVTVADTPFAPGTVTRQIPAPGQAWADSKLAAALGVKIGDNITVGARELRLDRILISRPDQGSAFQEFSASLLMNEADLASTQLIQPASQVRHALLIAGERPQLNAFRDWHAQQAGQRERMADVSEDSPQIGDATRRAGRFLGLASLVAILLCAVAVAMSARSYVRRHLDAVALMKTLGASRAFVLTVSVTQLLLLALAATALGSVMGWITQSWLISALQGLLRTDLPPAGLQPMLIGLLVAVAMLAGFALPSLLQMTRVPALRVLRRDVGPPTPGAWAAVTPAVVAVIVVVYGTLGDAVLSGWFVGALAAATLILGGAGWGLVSFTAHSRGGSGVAWRYGIASLARRRVESVTQIVAFGLGIMLLLVLATLRRDLVTDWRASIPANIPNYFFVNIPSGEQEEFRARLTAQGGKVERMLPMVRGRLVTINDRDAHAVSSSGGPAGPDDGPPQRGGMADREQNLTWSSELGDDNRIVAGQWWQPGDEGKPLVSLATEFQEELGLKLGDRLGFDIAGERITVTVASFREVKWDSFKPNFFIVFPPGLLDGAAGTYMTSALFEPSSPGEMTDFVRRFPTVSVFDVGSLLAQVRSMIDKAVTAVQSVFVFTLLAGLTVLLAAVQASRDERSYETAVLRVLGAQRGMIVRSVLTEFSALGLLAGTLAASGAAFGGFMLARQLELNYRFNLTFWLLGVLGTVAIVGFTGWVATRSVLNHPPRSALS